MVSFFGQDLGQGQWRKSVLRKDQYWSRVSVGKQRCFYFFAKRAGSWYPKARLHGGFAQKKIFEDLTAGPTLRHICRPKLIIC